MAKFYHIQTTIKMCKVELTAIFNMS